MQTVSFKTLCLQTHFPLASRIPYRYKYKFLRATTANIPGNILKDNRGSKLTMGGSGLLKVQHLIPVKLTHAQQQQMDPGNNMQQGRVSYIEFYVMPEEEGDTDA